jgi:hypothetical protein
VLPTLVLPLVASPPPAPLLAKPPSAARAALCPPHPANGPTSAPQAIATSPKPFLEPSFIVPRLARRLALVPSESPPVRKLGRALGIHTSPDGKLPQLKWQEITYENLPASRISAAAFGASNYQDFNGATYFPISQRTVLLAYVDTLGQIDVGQITDGYDQKWYVWVIDGVTPVDLDIAAFEPGRYDILIRDSNRQYWDCYNNTGGWDQNGNPTLPAQCLRWTASSNFNTAPAAVGLGDGRLFVVGTTLSGGYNDVSADFVDQGAGTGFLSDPGGFIGGADVSSW